MASQSDRSEIDRKADPSTTNDGAENGKNTRNRRRVKMRFPVVVGLVAMLAVIAAVGVLVAVVDDAGMSGFEEANGDRLFPELSDRIPEIQGMRIAGPAETYVLNRSASGWKLADKDQYPVPDAKVVRFLENFSELRAIYVSTYEEPPYGEYGVFRPGESSIGVGMTVSVLDGSGDDIARATLGLPISVPGDSRKHVVVRREDGARIWIVDGDIEFPGMALDWVDRHLLDIPKSQVAKLVIVPPGGRRIAIERTPENDLTIAKGLSAQEELRGPWVLDRLVEAFESLTFVDVRSVEGIEALDPQPWEAEVTTANDLSYRVRLFRTDDADWATFQAFATDSERTAAVDAFNARHSAWAYHLPFQTVNRLTTEPGQLVK